MYVENELLNYIISHFPKACKHITDSTIYHKSYGEGILRLVNPEVRIMVISFKDNGIKQFGFHVISDNLITGLEMSDTRFNNMIAETGKTEEKIFVKIRLAKISEAIESLNYDLAEKLYQDIEALYPRDLFNKNINDKKAEQKQLKVNHVMQKINQSLDYYDFVSAEREFELIKTDYPRSSYNQLVYLAKRRQEKEQRAKLYKNTIRKIEEKLQMYDYASAEVLYQRIMNSYPKSKYLNLVKKYKKDELNQKINRLLSSSKFLEADELFFNTPILMLSDYLATKSSFVKDFVENKYRISINKEKAKALSFPRENTLITARAGSGKTLLLALKVAFLIDYYGCHPDQILVMAFNKKAATEIGERVRKRLNHPGFVNARTFHSLAYQLVKPNCEILFDESNYSISSRKLSGFVQRIVKEKIKNPVFMDKIYNHFRNESIEIEKAGFHLSDEDYLEYRRNLSYVTLNGQNVKSSGEKIIADFLFEHGKSYKYEDTKYWGKEIYRPDFSLYVNQKDYIIEFWGIDEFDPNRRVPEEWTVTWVEYRQQMQSKRNYCKKKSIKLIEFSIADTKYGREVFEKIISDKLGVNGISCEKIPYDRLIELVKANDIIITRITDLFTQFIQKAKKKLWFGEDVQNKFNSYISLDEREETFLDLAIRVYIEYEKLLRIENKIDFDELIKQAIDLVHETKGNCSISFGENKSHTISMNDIKWILVDEYQDFSVQFYELVNAIRQYNRDVKLFCVGDDWQAINSFAGSDLVFFEKFSHFVSPAYGDNLLTNFRSHKTIVDWGNSLMKNLGAPSTFLPNNNGGQVFVDFMDDVWIEQRNHSDYETDKKEDERFKITTTSLNKYKSQYYRVTASKYLKMCHTIITNPDNRDKTVAILARTNRIDGVTINHFKKILMENLKSDVNKCTNEIEAKLKVGTVHGYKGLEADLVIILQACNQSFPLIHPDSSLFRFFGVTLHEIIAEERRLFYVAISRAKSDLYLLIEKSRQSDYIDQIIKNNLNLSYSSILENEKISDNYSSEKSFLFDEILDDEIPF